MDILSKEYCTRRGRALDQVAICTHLKNKDAQVASVVSLVEAPANHRKVTTVAKEAMAIKYGNMTDHSIKKFIESPFAGKLPKQISKGTKAAAAEAAVTAAEAIAVADSEETNCLAAEFEAIGGGALTMALAQEAKL
jgi:hypothetical protein